MGLPIIKRYSGTQEYNTAEQGYTSAEEGNTTADLMDESVFAESNVQASAVSPNTAIRNRTEELFQELLRPSGKNTSGPVADRTRSKIELRNRYQTDV